MVDRVNTGIKGFDELVEGGLPKGSVTLLTGIPGTGKTIFGLHYIYTGASDGETGLYVSIEQTPEELKAQAARFGMDFEKLEKAGKVIFMTVPKDNSKFNLFKVINDLSNKISAKRIVFDNLSTFDINIGRFVSLWGADTPREIMQAPTAWGDKVQTTLIRKQCLTA